jgi:hypothetical protein
VCKWSSTEIYVGDIEFQEGGAVVKALCYKLAGHGFDS